MRIRALIKRIAMQMLRDKRTLALLFIAPLLILTLMYFLFNGSTVEPKLGVVNVDNTLIDILKSQSIKVFEYKEGDRDTILSENLDGLLKISDGKLKLTLTNSDPSQSKALQMKVSQGIAKAAQLQRNKSDKTVQAAANLEVDYIYGDTDTTFFDVLSPVLVGFFVFFFVFIISGIGLLRERTTGTLERLMSTPIHRIELVMGYLTGYGIFALIQTILIVLYSVNILNIALVGSIWSVITINLLLALVALSLGILLSTFAASEFQMLQFIPLVIVPQIFFAGIFPLEGMAKWLQVVAKIMPLYYGADALKGVMYKGWGFNKVIEDIIILIVFTLVFIILNILALKKYRKQ